jgi:serine/threonine-protein kinase
MSTQAKVGIAVGAAGVVAVGIGSYFGLRAMSKWDEAKDHCGGTTLCTRQGVDLHDQAEVSGNVSTVLFALGAAAVGTGVVLFLKAPSSKTETRLGAQATRGGALLSLGGTL